MSTTIHVEHSSIDWQECSTKKRVFNKNTHSIISKSQLNVQAGLRWNQLFAKAVSSGIDNEPSNAHTLALDMCFFFSFETLYTSFESPYYKPMIRWEMRAKLCHLCTIQVRKGGKITHNLMHMSMALFLCNQHSKLSSLFALSSCANRFDKSTRSVRQHRRLECAEKAYDDDIGPKDYVLIGLRRFVMTAIKIYLDEFAELLRES